MITSDLLQVKSEFLYGYSLFKIKWAATVNEPIFLRGMASENQIKFIFMLDRVNGPTRSIATHMKKMAPLAYGT